MDELKFIQFEKELGCIRGNMLLNGTKEGGGSGYKDAKYIPRAKILHVLLGHKSVKY